jgi:hypothetical protein
VIDSQLPRSLEMQCGTHLALDRRMDNPAAEPGGDVMNTATPQTPMNANPSQSDADFDSIPLYDRLVLWMFALGFAVIGLIILGDLIVGLFR